jgi:glucosamine--fructose-6-phosphate aminotransferase (isomerizing)
LGYGDGCNFIASDVTALVEYTRDVSYMEDGEVAVLTCDSITVLNAMELPVVKEHHRVDWEISAAEKGGYPHFMFKEIMEEPEAVRRAISPRIRDGRVVFEGSRSRTTSCGAFRRSRSSPAARPTTSA